MLDCIDGCIFDSRTLDQSQYIIGAEGKNRLSFAIFSMFNIDEVSSLAMTDVFVWSKSALVPALDVFFNSLHEFTPLSLIISDYAFS
jgi:hypothetical protein